MTLSLSSPRPLLALDPLLSPGTRKKGKEGGKEPESQPESPLLPFSSSVASFRLPTLKLTTSRAQLPYGKRKKEEEEKEMRHERKKRREKPSG